MIAEFEEKEFENPLNLQLLANNPYIWSPGQVFEGNFGIDAALNVTRIDFWKMVGYPFIPDGINLNSFSFGYVWRAIKGKRPLPTFALNLFLQVKRPYGMRNRTSELKRMGLQTPYWRFETKKEQHDLLLRLKNKLENRAFVAYGAAAFHTHQELFRHTEEVTLVENSTFIKVEKLKGHHRWVYDKPGSVGFGMSEPEFINEINLFDEVTSAVEISYIANDNPSANLQVISTAITDSCEELSNNSIIAREILKRYSQNRELVDSVDARRFINVINFSILTNSSWMVLR